MFNHMSGELRLARLVIAGLQAGKGEHLGRILKFSEISELREDHSNRELSETRIDRQGGLIPRTHSLI